MRRYQTPFTCFKTTFMLLLAAVFLAGCGGGGGDDSPEQAPDSELAAIQERINSAGGQWSASHTSVSGLPEEKRKLKCGTRLTVKRSRPGELKIKMRTDIPPAYFDWRDRSVVSPVQDQKDCSADWAFAPVAALESLLLIQNGLPRIDLSEQIVLSCSGDCSGGYVDNATAFLLETGTKSETCSPYAGQDLSCQTVREACAADTARKCRGEAVAASVDAIKNAVYENGPAVSVMMVYTDFFYYHSGIYSNLWGDHEGYLAVLITGWDDSGRFFTAKNSWGDAWGENGFFRISYDELEKGRFGLQIVSYELIEPPNTPPAAHAGDDRTVAAGAVTTLDGSESEDIETHIESYSWIQLGGPDVELSDISSVSPVFTAPQDIDTEIVLTFQLTVTDSQGASASDTCGVTVIPPEKNFPKADAGKDQHVIEEDLVTLDASGSSAASGRTLTFQWTQTYGVEVSLSDSASEKPSFSAPRMDRFAERLTFELEIKDSEGLIASDEVNVVVHPNQPPEVRVSLDQYVESGDRVVLEGTAEDQEERFEYEWTQTGGVRVNLLDRDTLSPYFIAPDAGEEAAVLTFRLEAADHLGLTDTAETNVIITTFPIDVNRAMCPSDCKLIVSICACPEACEFRAGWVIGVELRILTPGVYWAEDPDMPAFSSAGANCYQGGYELEFSRYPDYGKACAAAEHTHKFSISYYDADGQRVNGPGFQASNRAKIVRTPSPYDGYELVDEDVQNQYCDLWIDMPAMQAVPGEINPGSQLVVRASLLTAPPLEQTAGCDDPDYLRPTTALAPPECQVGTGLTGNGNCRWRWDQSFCSACAGVCYCDKLLGTICCSK